MKTQFSEKFKEQVEADDLDSLVDRYFGKVGTYRRYQADRRMLKLTLKETFFTLLFWPLRLLPWGHIASTWWFYFCTEKFHSALDGMAFSYINDAYVLGVREYLSGTRHCAKVELCKCTKEPYQRPFRYPLWLLTKVTWPQVRSVQAQRKEFYK